MKGIVRHRGWAGVLVAGVLAVGCPPSGPDPEEVCEGPDCEDEPKACALWEPDCCERTRQPGDAFGRDDCYGLGTPESPAICHRPDDSLGTCILLCNHHDECADFYPEDCGDGSCVCDYGRCLPAPCSADVDCPGALSCVAGWCEAGVADPDGCVIAPDAVRIREGEDVALTVHATKDGAYVVAAYAFSWSTADASIAGVDAASGVVTGGTVPGNTVVEARLGDASCTIDVHVLALLADPDALRVLVLDAVAHRPVADATVVVDAPGESPVTAETGADGTASFGGVPAGAPVDVHVFSPADDGAPAGRHHVSVIGTSARDLLLLAERNPAPRAGGIRGVLQAPDFAHISGDTVHVAITGLSLPDLLRLDPRLLFGGESTDVHVQFGAMVDEVMPLPTGLVMGHGEEFFKDWYAPLGAPGRRAGWVLGGNVSVPDWTLAHRMSLWEGDPDSLRRHSVKDLTGLFEQFHSGITPGVSVSEADRHPDDDGRLVPAFDDPRAFPEVPLSLDAGQRLFAVVDVPRLPTVDGAFVHGAFVIGGGLLPGQGFVPLGIAAALDVIDADAEDADGIVSDTPEDPFLSPGQVPLRMAPRHGGLEDGALAVVALATSFDGLTVFYGSQPDPTFRGAVSGRVAWLDRLGFEERVDFGADGFLPFAESASYDAGSRTLAPDPVEGATFHRTILEGEDGRRWTVLHAAADAAVTLPDPAEYGLADLVAPALTAQAIRTDGPGLDALLDLGAPTLPDLNHHLLGFSTIGPPAPEDDTDPED